MTIILRRINSIYFWEWQSGDPHSLGFLNIPYNSFTTQLQQKLIRTEQYLLEQFPAYSARFNKKNRTVGFIIF